MWREGTLGGTKMKDLMYARAQVASLRAEGYKSANAIALNLPDGSAEYVVFKSATELANWKLMNRDWDIPFDELELEDL